MDIKDIKVGQCVVFDPDPAGDEPYDPTNPLTQPALMPGERGVAREIGWMFDDDVMVEFAKGIDKCAPSWLKAVN